jgi:AcrR family transcriptional regulator
MAEKQTKPQEAKAAGGHRARQKARTRRIIQQAAQKLFEERGFEKTTIRAVAQEAGVGLGTVMSHFTDKTTLLVASLMDDWDATLTRTMEGMPPELSVRDQVLHVIGAYFRYYARRPALSRVLLKELVFASGPGEREIKDKEIQMTEIGIARMETARARGEIKPDVDCTVATRAVFAFYLQVLYEGLAQDKPSPRQMLKNMTKLVDQYWTGIAAPLGDSAQH